MVCPPPSVTIRDASSAAAVCLWRVPAEHVVHSFLHSESAPGLPSLKAQTPPIPYVSQTTTTEGMSCAHLSSTDRLVVCYSQVGAGHTEPPRNRSTCCDPASNIISCSAMSARRRSAGASRGASLSPRESDDEERWGSPRSSAGL